MRSKFLLVLLMLFLSNNTWSETPAERAQMFFNDMKKRHFSMLSDHFDPVQLKEFRAMMQFYKEIPEQAKSQAIQSIFGADQTLESVEKMTDAQFFTKLMELVMRRAEAFGKLTIDSVEILGGVEEGDDIRHLVTRTRVSVGELTTTKMEVLSLKRFGDEWRIQLSGKMKGLPNQLKAAFAKAKKEKMMP